MSAVVADTQAIVWFLKDVARLSPAADAALTAASQSGQLYIATISLVELFYLKTKPSFGYGNLVPDLLAIIADPNEPLTASSLSVDVVAAAEQIPRAEIPDMPDRVIAATAVALKLPLVSADSKIRGSATLAGLVPVIW